MVGGILLLAIVIFSISVLFGKGKIETYFVFAVLLIVAPLLLFIGFNHSLWFWLHLPLWMQTLSLLLIPFSVSALLRVLFPKAKWLQGLQTVIFQTLVYAVTFPFRFLWRAGMFLLQRERQTVRLDPLRSVIGKKPPIINEREKRDDQNNLFDW